MPTPVIHLPSRLCDMQTLSRVLPPLFEKYADSFPAEVVVDFSGLRFVEPVGVAFATNLIHWLRNGGIQCKLRAGAVLSQPLRYLDDSGFFAILRGEPLRPFAHVRPTTTGMKLIAQERSHAWIEQELSPWLMRQVTLPPPSFYPLNTCFVELFNNVADHSSKTVGCIFGQHYPNRREVVVAFSDFGVGLASRVREVESQLTESDAIIRACDEGFSTRGNPKNRGAGLRYLLDVVVLACNGNVTISSLGGSVKFRNVEGAVVPSIVQGIGYCPGTTIELCIPTANIRPEADEVEDFQW